MNVAETPQIAKLMGKSERQTRRVLARLEARGLVHRVGQRGGWRLTDVGERFLGLPPSTAQAAAGEVIAIDAETT